MIRQLQTIHMLYQENRKYLIIYLAYDVKVSQNSFEDTITALPMGI